MNSQKLFSTAIISFLLAGSPVFLLADEPTKEEQLMFSKMLTAVEKVNYDAFVVDGSPEFREKMKKDEFEKLIPKLAEQLVGYEPSYLCRWEKQGAQITLWKLTFKDGRDPLIVTLRMKDGKVGGFGPRPHNNQ